MVKFQAITTVLMMCKYTIAINAKSINNLIALIIKIKIRNKPILSWENIYQMIF